MEVNIPRCEELSFEGLRAILIQMSSIVNHTFQRQQELESLVQSELGKRLTLEQTIQAFSTEAKPAYVDLNTVNWLLRELSETVVGKLDGVEAMQGKHDSQIQRLFTKVHSYTASIKQQFDHSIKLSVQSLKYSMRNRLEQHRQSRMQAVLSDWKRYVHRKKAFRLLLKERLKRIHHTPQAYYLELWRKHAAESKQEVDYTPEFGRISRSLQEMQNA